MRIACPRRSGARAAAPPSLLASHPAGACARRAAARLLATAAAALALWLPAGGCAAARTAPRIGPDGLLPVGVAQVDITPMEPIRLTGYGNRTRPAAEVSQRLWAKALAFGDGPHASVLLTADVVGVPRAMTDALAERLRNVGIAREAVAVTATHTHTGPSLTAVLPFIFGAPLSAHEERAVEAYSESLLDRLEAVALDALADRRPARVAWGRGTARFAANRRIVENGKWTGFGVNPAGAVDHDLPVLTVRDPEGALRVVLVSYACHATTLEGSDNFVHGDWPGSAQALIQARHPGATALVTIGTGADSNPNPRGGGLADVERHAREIADEVDRLLGTTLRPVTAAPTGRLRSLDLRFARIPARDDWDRRSLEPGAAGLHAQFHLERLDRGEPLPNTVPYPVQTWAFGDDLAMVFLAGEVVADYGLRLKRELDGSRLWVNAYSNDVAFYVPSRRLIPEGGYEVDRSMIYYGQPGSLAAETEDRIVRTVHELLPAGFRSRR